jgi:hypothetical protein
VKATAPEKSWSVVRSFRSSTAEIMVDCFRSGQPRKAVQYDIGNPLTAMRMTQHQLPASLYAPLRVVLYESEAGGASFEYDRPSSLFGQFGDERVTAVARELDASLERVLVKAAS